MDSLPGKKDKHADTYNILGIADPDSTKYDLGSLCRYFARLAIAPALLVSNHRVESRKRRERGSSLPNWSLLLLSACRLKPAPKESNLRKPCCCVLCEYCGRLCERSLGFQKCVIEYPNKRLVYCDGVEARHRSGRRSAVLGVMS